MFASTKNKALSATAALLALTLFGCGNLSTIDERGKSPSPVWPDLTDSSMTLRHGIYPDRTKLAMVKAGMTKDQLYYLLGRPHFLEGFFLVREWDYVFILTTSTEDKTCQYKVLFDKDARAREFLWREKDCEAIANASVRKDSA